MAKEYEISLKYNGFPEFKLITTADSDEEAMKKVVNKIIREHPQLNGQEPLRSNVLKSNDPY